MVLSNRKLKQKLRAGLAESLVATAAVDKPNDNTKQDVKSQGQSLKELLSSVTQKTRLSKREKRRKNLSSKVFEGSNDESQKGSQDTDAEDLNDKKNKKKRKRDDNRNQERENGVSELTKEKPTKKSKKKTKKKKNKKKNKGVESGSGEINGEVLEGSVKPNESQVTEDVATKVYVGGIPYYSSEDDIRSFFEGCGTITEIDCLRFPESGKFRGIAMITFKTEAAAKRALALDGADMGGLFLKIQPYKINRPQDTSDSAPADFAPAVVEGYNRIYIGNLSWDIKEDELRKVFSDCNILSIRFGKDKETGEFRGYAHIDFSDSLSQAMALTLDQKVVSGRPVKVRCAVPKKETKTHPRSEVPTKNIENDGLSSGSGKKKRRTCYECGVPGHLSSACPKKKAVDPLTSNNS
ncbi:hypothetical protein NE237_011474 [Protea cynaroides]|uniref:Protein gar2 n=1 Tax=Protea cynaroides TaxID=273540 RepID=A0A9Q0JWT9_9MAGN|nr:hypothetical protein NE237_011474 [Protea cynaroides]